MKLPDSKSLSEQQLFLYNHDINTQYAPSGDLIGESYRFRNKLMLTLIEKSIRKDTLILDVGSAQGNLALTLAERGFNVLATDLRFEFLQYSRMKFEYGNINFIQCSCVALPFKMRFDAVILGEIIEHIAYPELLLKNSFDVLKEGGILVLSTPNGRQLLSYLPTFGQLKDRVSLESRQFKPDSDGHLFLFKYKEIKELLESFGFFVKEIYYWGSPLLSGRYKVRYISKLLPFYFVRILDKFITKLPLVKEFLSSGLIILAKKNNGKKL